MQDRFGRTPLQWASEKGHVQTVEALLDMGANLRECDNLGRSPRLPFSPPIYLSCYLIFRTAIHLAARSGEAEVLERLLDPIQEEAEVKQLISAADHKGITPVFLAKQRYVDRDAFSQKMMLSAPIEDPKENRPFIYC